MGSPRAKNGRNQWPWRGLKIAGGVFAALLVGWGVFASINIVSPPQGNLNDRSDAVVSLAPQAHRLATAQQLVEAGTAETLVISYFPSDVSNDGPGTSGVSVSEYCEGGRHENIMCFTPEENATIGEAYAIREIARAENWNSLTVVTSEYHAFRTRYIFEQCLGDEVDVNVVFPEAELSTTRWGFHLVYENAAFLKAVWQTAVRC